MNNAFTAIPGDFFVDPMSQPASGQAGTGAAAARIADSATGDAAKSIAARMARC